MSQSAEGILELIALEAAVCEEPADGAVLENRALFDPEIADKAFAARVDPLDKLFGE